MSPHSELPWSPNHLAMISQSIWFLRLQPARLRYKSLVASAKEAVRQPLRRRKWNISFENSTGLGVRFSTSLRGFWNPRTAPMPCPWGASQRLHVGEARDISQDICFQISNESAFGFLFLTCYLLQYFFFQISKVLGRYFWRTPVMQWTNSFAAPVVFLGAVAPMQCWQCCQACKACCLMQKWKNLTIKKWISWGPNIKTWSFGGSRKWWYPKIDGL